MKYKEIKLNGVTMPIAFNWGALYNYELLTGQSSSNVVNDMQEKPLAAGMPFIFSALKEGHRLAREKFTLELEDVANIIGEDPEGFEKTLALLAESMPEPGEEKKN